MQNPLFDQKQTNGSEIDTITVIFKTESYPLFLCIFLIELFRFFLFTYGYLYLHNILYVRNIDSAEMTSSLLIIIHIFFFIPLLWLLIKKRNKKHETEFNDFFSKKHGYEKVTMKIEYELPKYSPWFTILFLWFPLGIAFEIAGSSGHIVIGIFNFIVSFMTSMFVIYCLLAFNEKKPQFEKYIVERKEGNAIVDTTKNHPTLFNGHPQFFRPKDETNEEYELKILKIEADLKRISHTLESYFLESTFLGGVSFAGFLTILSSDTFSNYSKISEILNGMYLEVQSRNAWEIIEYFASVENYLLLVMFLCLACTVFFLVVLILKSQYTSILLEVGKYVTELLFLNKKIEELEKKQQNQAGFPSIQSDAFKKSKDEIEIKIKNFNEVMEKLKSVESAIKAIRGWGIIFFYLILVVSGFYFSRGIATFILAFGVLAYLYSVDAKNTLGILLKRFGIWTR